MTNNIFYSSDFGGNEYEKQHSGGYNRKTIDGKTVGCSRCVGYCRYDGHPGYLTAELRKKHNCCKKNCNYYISKPRRQRSDD